MTFAAGARPVAFVNVGNRERARSFYRDTLGLPLLSSDDFGEFYEVGPGLMRLTELQDHRAGPHPVLGWHTPDIAAAVAALKARGIAMTIYPGFGQDEAGIWTAPDGSARVAWFQDPDGNVLSLSQ